MGAKAKKQVTKKGAKKDAVKKDGVKKKKRVNRNPRPAFMPRASAHLQWMILKNNSCHLRKGINGEQFNVGPLNLKGKNSFKHSFIRAKAIGIEPCKDGKGVTMVMSNPKNMRKPVKALHSIEFKRDARRTFKSIKNIIKKSPYRKDLRMPALRKASAILQSQKPVVAKKVHKKKRAE